MKRRLPRFGAPIALIAMLGAICFQVATASAAPTVGAGARVTLTSGAGVGPASPSGRGTRHKLTARLASLHAASSTSTSAVVQAPSALPHGSNLSANFDGVGSLDSAVTNFGAEFEPPDQGLCAGNGYVVEMVNSAFRVYDTHGNTLAGPTNVNAPFHDGFAQFTSDPRCVYDASTGTWFAVILFLNDTFTGSQVQIAVNTTGDPRKPWTDFDIDTTRANAPASFGCPCFGDQPTLGIDSSNLYTTTNEFSILGPEFNGAQIYAVSKSDLIHHIAKVHFVHYQDVMIDGNLASSIQPASTYGAAPAEYFLSSLDPNGTGDNRIAVWSLTNVNRVGHGGVPTLSSTIIGSEAYAIPPAAQQQGSTSLLDSGDDRMQQTQFIDGEIWGELGTQVTVAGDTAPRAGAAWFRVRPRLQGSNLAGATLTGQGYVASRGNYVIYPALQANAQGHAAMVFAITGPHRFASAAYAVLSDEGGFGRPVVAAAGTGAYDPNATRWGDYSWAVLDPSGGGVWMATEYIPPAASQTTDGLRNWGTRVIHLTLD